MQFSEHVDDCQNRTDKLRTLLKDGVSFEDALAITFCLEKDLAQHYVGQFFAEIYADMMNYKYEDKS